MTTIKKGNNMATLEEIQQDTKLYMDRINELNEIIGQLDKENEILKMNLKIERQNIEFYKKFCNCKYPPYMVSDFINDNFFVKISSHKIVKEATENNIFADELKAIRIPRKRGPKEKHASTVLFSIVGIAELLELLSRKYLINLKISKDYFEKSINQYKSGKIKQVNELFR